MQFADEPRALLFVDDEAQVEVICCLRHQVDALLFENLERWCQARQECSDLAADKAHGGTIGDKADATKRFEICDERLQYVFRQFAVRGVDGNRNVGL